MEARKALCFHHCNYSHGMESVLFYVLTPQVYMGCQNPLHHNLAALVTCSFSQPNIQG